MNKNTKVRFIKRNRGKIWRKAKCRCQKCNRLVVPLWLIKKYRKKVLVKYITNTVQWKDRAGIQHIYGIATIDHIIPVNLGGKNLNNIQLLCKECHELKTSLEHDPLMKRKKGLCSKCGSKTKGDSYRKCDCCRLGDRLALILGEDVALEHQKKIEEYNSSK